MPKLLYDHEGVHAFVYLKAVTFLDAICECYLMVDMGTNKYSPLLSGAVEDLGHALEHMEIGNQKDCKYAIIHAATAVDLLLKEKIRSMGLSIFKKKPPYHSLNFYDCIELLHEKEVLIPSEADIELLHQERNICIHQAGKPDSEKTRWLLDTARTFMREFCSKALGVAIDYLLPICIPKKVQENAVRAHLNPSQIYLGNAYVALYAKRFSDAIFNAAVSVELLLRDYLSSQDLEVGRGFDEMLVQMTSDKRISRMISGRLRKLQELRKKVVHSTIIAKEDDADTAINLAVLTQRGISNLWKRQECCAICGSTKVVGREWESPPNLSIIESRKDLNKAIENSKEWKDKRLVGYYCKKHEPYWAR